MLLQEKRRLLAERAGNFFLHGLAKPEVEPLIDLILARTQRDNKRACILKARFVVWLVIAMSVFREQSILNVFERLVSLMGESGDRLPRRVISEEAIYHARKRLGVAPLKELFQAIRPKREELPCTFNGLRVFGIDGTNFDLPDTPQNAAVFQRHTSQNKPASFPQVQGVFLSELSTHRILQCLFVPCLTAEILCVPFLLKSLGVGDLLLMDSGLASFKNMKLCLEQETHFVFRFRKNWKPKIKKVLGDGDYIAEFKPSAKAKIEYGPQPLILRVLEFTVGENKRVRLVTDLIDPLAFPAIELAKLYHRRWECELIYKEIKSQLLVTGRTKTPAHFRSKSPVGVLQECWGTAIAHVLARDLVVEAAIAGDQPILHLSFTEAVDSIKSWIPRFQREVFLVPSLRRELALNISRCLIDRPRRKRRFPRVVKSRAGRRPLKKKTHKETPLDLTIHFIRQAA